MPPAALHHYLCLHHIIAVYCCSLVSCKLTLDIALSPGQQLLLSLCYTDMGRVDWTSLMSNRALRQLGHQSTARGLGWHSLPNSCRMHSTCVQQIPNSQAQLKMACQGHQASQLMPQQAPVLAALQSELAYAAPYAKSSPSAAEYASFCNGVDAVHQASAHFSIGKVWCCNLASACIRIVDDVMQRLITSSTTC